jgi:hypothetical protein
MEFIQQFFDHQNRKLALHRVLIEGPVIHAKAPRFIIFLNQEHQRRKSRGAGADDATVPHGHTLPFKLDLLQCAYRYGRTAIDVMLGRRWM